ncbi:hypothetical protein FHG65_18835 [Bacillus cereus]|uniref:MAE-28990/MAE-18760-like HEPN domain-containing protein n=1 Tax=Bacillus cereus TaxID=1396 RepID=A0ABD7RDQ4_BACCE|nr:hypothetical protein [Bacillus cereus]TNB96926.1 hypothetical protein FHG65_18835 [Bacillus cereus]
MDAKNEEFEHDKKDEQLREEIQKEMNGYTQSIRDVHKNYIQPMLDGFSIGVENMQPFFEMAEHITGLMNIINWESISDAAAERIKEIDRLLQEYEQDFWCLDYEILDDIEEGITLEIVSVYVDKNLESYVEAIIKEPMYELHVSLIKETYEAYKKGFYKLCAMSLFAAFEHVIASWRAGNIKAEMVSVKQNPKVFKLYNKIKPEVYSDIEQVQFSKVFALSVLRMFKRTFVKIPDELCQELNRNSIAHGFHNYDSLNKTDILKLFQLLKSTLVIKYLDINEIEN